VFSVFDLERVFQFLIYVCTHQQHAFGSVEVKKWRLDLILYAKYRNKK
jgi:hypothetical protein